MAYVEKVLTSGESVIYQARISWWSQLPLLILGVLSLAAAGIGLIFLLAAVINYFSTELAITNKRVIAKFGFIRRTTIEINLSRIESIQVRQGLLGRVFDYGSIVVSGAGNPQAPIPSVSNPLGFRRAFAESQERFSQPGMAAAA
jgi:uncharacterized membrane protein YdbT with pleckstrin-like domain